jgi:hypothetical protein
MIESRDNLAHRLHNRRHARLERSRVLIIVAPELGDEVNLLKGPLGRAHQKTKPHSTR